MKCAICGKEIKKLKYEYNNKIVCVKCIVTKIIPAELAQEVIN